MRHRISLLVRQLKSSETSKAAGLAGAMIVNNCIALIASVVFARMLGDGYGSLAALVSYLVILTVVGQAVQVTTARDGVLGRLGKGEDLLATLERWARTFGIFTLGATIVSVALRHPIADAVGVPHQSWAAAAGIRQGARVSGRQHAARHAAGHRRLSNGRPQSHRRAGYAAGCRGDPGRGWTRDRRRLCRLADLLYRDDRVLHAGDLSAPSPAQTTSVGGCVTRRTER